MANQVTKGDVEMMKIALEELRGGEQVVIGSRDHDRDKRILNDLGASPDEIAQIIFKPSA